MDILRTKFKSEIVCEFIPPTRRSSRKVLIILKGAPSIPYSRNLMEFFSRFGWWTFLPRYRGTWESGGSFLKKSPEQDVLDVIDSLPNGFRDSWSGQKLNVDPKRIVLVGVSFGGPAAILASRDPRVDRAIVVSGVVDWKKLGPKETFDIFRKFTKDTFENVYRGKEKNWNRLKRGEIYNPIMHIDEIDGKKLLFVHAKDDDSVPYESVRNFAKKVGSKLITVRSGGHVSSLMLLKPSIAIKIAKFIKSNN